VFKKKFKLFSLKRGGKVGRFQYGRAYQKEMYSLAKENGKKVKEYAKRYKSTYVKRTFRRYKKNKGRRPYSYFYGFLEATWVIQIQEYFIFQNPYIDRFLIANLNNIFFIHNKYTTTTKKTKTYKLKKKLYDFFFRNRKRRYEGFVLTRRMYKNKFDDPFLDFNWHIATKFNPGNPKFERIKNIRIMNFRDHILEKSINKSFFRKLINIVKNKIMTKKKKPKVQMLERFEEINKLSKLKKNKKIKKLGMYQLYYSHLHLGFLIESVRRLGSYITRPFNEISDPYARYFKSKTVGPHQVSYYGEEIL
jgi:hypothetical protein